MFIQQHLLWLFRKLETKEKTNKKQKQNKIKY